MDDNWLTIRNYYLSFSKTTHIYSRLFVRLLCLIIARTGFTICLLYQSLYCLV